MSTIKDVLKTLDRDWFYSALRTLERGKGVERENRLLAVAYARRAQHLMTDPRSVAALSVAERYANGEATEQELYTARDAARDVAAEAAVHAAEAAARAAAADAAEAAARDVAAAADAAAFRADRIWQEAELRRVCECIEAGTDPYPRGES